MPCHALSRHRTERELCDGTCGFSGALLAVKYLRTHIDTYPDATTPQTIDALLGLIRSQRFDNKKQVFFLLGEAADALIALCLASKTATCAVIIKELQKILAGASGPRVRALGNAVGKLPVRLSSTPQVLPEPREPCPVSLDSLVNAFGSQRKGTWIWRGRSLILPLENGCLGVLKFARSCENLGELSREHYFQGQLATLYPAAEKTWQLPRPVTIQDASALYKVTDPLPGRFPEGLYKGICIAYTAPLTYFEYPNESVSPDAWDRIEQVFFNTARILGQLTEKGLFHTALIPLFHNRVQQDRRRDSGRYLWEHGGRLDQWLDSCRFPNFSLSGLRDFEHLEPALSSKDLRHYIGEHLLSFILVMGSCFRSQAPQRRGLDSSGAPADTRDLFDPARFTCFITGVCTHYFSAFSEEPLPQVFKNRIPDLVTDLISAMGIDRDMEERLRIRDQESMGQKTYEDFLAARGISPAPPRATEDIILATGPHLGGFNQTISVPGLVDFLYNFSSLCISYCFAKENLVETPGELSYSRRT